MGRALLTIVLLVAAVAVGAHAQCSVTGTDGNVYDLSPLKGQTYSTPNGNYPQYNENIAVCGDVVTGQPLCQATAAVCEVSSGGISFASTLGTNPATLVQEGTNLVMTYTKVSMTVIITFSCGTSPGSPIYASEGGGSMKFTWATQYACAGSGGGGGGGSGGGGGGGGGSSSSGLSGGDVFLIIFFVGAFLYVAVGAAIKYQRYDARGVDMIPNIDFWRELPGLIKDGFVFTGQKFKSLFNKS